MPKYKVEPKIVGPNRLQAKCTCGWAGSVMVGDTDLSGTLTACVSEGQAHKHIPKKKEKK